jgi:CRP/FNR family transcriptional regulator, polysaccharide utilization system transcription regulator
MIDFDVFTDCNQCTCQCIVQYINANDIDKLNANKSEIFYSPGQVIAKQSSFCPNIIFLSTGVVKLVKEGKGGKNTIVKLVGDNSFITLPLHENQKKYPFTAVALTDVKICEINESVIHNSISENQKLKDFLLDSYYSDHIFFMNSLHLINTRNNHGKLAASLLYLNSFNKGGFSIFEYITRKDLAELSSISLESVNKILQELKSDKIIDINNKGLQLKQLGLLEKLSNIG